MQGLLAALWLLGLFAAAPALRAERRYPFADRLRDALALGVAIPLALGFVHALYSATCWIALAACAAIGYARDRSGIVPRTPASPVPYVLIAALAAVAWPQLMRPLLDGDSLSYHLPNAASWVQSHSIWTTVTRYWWYPPASELFASGLYAASGPFGLPWCGLGALALLGFRIAAWARESGAQPLLADALAAATVTAYPLALQAGTLQNDVWLAAFWLESLWTIGRDDAPAMRSVAIAALTKPQGWIFSAIALVAARAKPKIWIAAAAAVGVWGIRDVLLWRYAILAPASTAYGSTFASSILAHGIAGLALFARVAFVASPFVLLAIAAALLGPFYARRDARLAWSGSAAALLFFALPFGFASNVAQLATGASLRFAAPAIAAGALLLARPATRVATIATLLLWASTLFGAFVVLALFANDAPTLLAPLVALLAIGVVALTRRQRAAWAIPAGIVAGAIAGSLLAASHPVDFYADALRVSGRATGLYAWIARRQPDAIGGTGLALGAVNVLSPRTRTVEAGDVAACALAGRDRLWLVAVAEDGRAAAFNARRLRDARACGAVLYDDGSAVVASP
ncbi:MAG TPA: hypothetical protein VMU38_09150 [Candidatus Binatia bacterium]|nr:hypothetical protein [Candidatus Binatia bacterium]